MTQVTNGPGQITVIRAEVRKSFSFGLWIRDYNGRLLDISNTQIALIAKDVPLDGSDASNLIFNSQAELVAPVSGYARFNLQASDLDHKVGEYPFSIVLHDSGYSSVLAKGVLDLVENVEFSSVADTYTPGNPATTLQIRLRGKNVVDITTGAILPPGTTSFTDVDKAKLDGIEEGAQVHVPADWNAVADADGAIRNKPNFGTAAFVDVEAVAVPRGGSPGEVLAKLSSADHHVAWVQIPGGGGGGGALDPTGVLAGKVPTANGVDGWSWEYVIADVQSVNGQIGLVQLGLDDIPDSATRLAMTPDERTKLAALETSIEWSNVQNKPNFGSAALEEASAFIKRGGINASTDFETGVTPSTRVPRLSEHRGFTYGTTPPSGGADGDLYFQYT